MKIKIKDHRMINHIMRRKLQDAIAEENKRRREYRTNKETYVEMIEDGDKRKDKILMEDLRKIANRIIPMLITEVDFPARNPELGYTDPILD